MKSIVAPLALAVLTIAASLQAKTMRIEDMGLVNACKRCSSCTGVIPGGPASTCARPGCGHGIQLHNR